MVWNSLVLKKNRRGTVVAERSEGYYEGCAVKRFRCNVCGGYVNIRTDTNSGFYHCNRMLMEVDWYDRR